MAGRYGVAEGRYGEWIREKQLGAGACGTVYMWRNGSSGDKIAIKKCKLETRDAMRRWQTEKGMIKEMHHPNIVSYIEIPSALRKEYPETVSLGMEYCCLGDLRKFIAQPEHCCGLPEYHVRDMMGDIGNAIQFLHEKNNMHRDLKPENIVLNPRPDCNGRCLYKITDLGYAKDLTNTVGRTLVGTLQYLAPELLLEQGGLNYNGEVDCWSFGLVVFECATGYRPFFHLSFSEPPLTVNLVKDKRDDEICAWHERGTQEPKFHEMIPQPHSLNPCFADDVVAWLRLMLCVDKNKRGGAGGTQWYKMLEEVLTKKYIHAFNTTNMQFMTFPFEDNGMLRSLQMRIQDETAVKDSDQILLLDKGATLSVNGRILERLEQINPALPEDPVVYFFEKHPQSLQYKSQTPDMRIQQYLDDPNVVIEQPERDGKRLMQIILHDIMMKIKTMFHFYKALNALVERVNKMSNNLQLLLQDFAKTNHRTSGMIELFEISLQKDIRENDSQNPIGICSGDAYKSDCEDLKNEIAGWNSEIEAGETLIKEARAELSQTRHASPHSELQQFHDNLKKLRSDSKDYYSRFRLEFKKTEHRMRNPSPTRRNRNLDLSLKTFCKNQLQTYTSDNFQRANKLLEDTFAPQRTMRQVMRRYVNHHISLERIHFAITDKKQKCDCVSSKLQEKQRIRQHSLWNMLQYMKDVYKIADSHRIDLGPSHELTTCCDKLQTMMANMTDDHEISAVLNFTPPDLSEQQNSQVQELIPLAQQPSTSNLQMQSTVAYEANSTTSKHAQLSTTFRTYGTSEVEVSAKTDATSQSNGGSQSQFP